MLRSEPNRHFALNNLFACESIPDFGNCFLLLRDIDHLNKTAREKLVRNIAHTHSLLCGFPHKYRINMIESTLQGSRNRSPRWRAARPNGFDSMLILAELAGVFRYRR